MRPAGARVTLKIEREKDEDIGDPSPHRTPGRDRPPRGRPRRHRRPAGRGPQRAGRRRRRRGPCPGPGGSHGHHRSHGAHRRTTATSSTSRSARRCAASRACPPSSRTSPRSSTGSCAWRGRARRRLGRGHAPSDAEISLRELAAARRDRRVAGARRPAAAPPHPGPRAPTSAPARPPSSPSSSRASGADTVVVDGDLAPSQRRALEDIVKVKVIDRTALILDIFAQHAKSREGKAQVELAQLEYLLPRLRGWGESMSRQAGGQVGGAGAGMGSRGPGETKIELDRRRIRNRMAKLRREIAAMEPARRAPSGPRASKHGDPVGRHRRLHQRRQVVAAQPADRRGRAGRERAVRDARPDRAPRADAGRARSTRCRTRSGSSGTCRTSSSRRSARRWRRSPRRTSCCTSSTRRTRTPRGRSPRSGTCSPTSPARWTSPRSSC